MKRRIKVLLITIAVIAGILTVAYIVIYAVSTYRLNKVYTFEEESLIIPSDSASLRAGQHIARIRWCEDCHGKDFGGRVLKSSPEFGVIAGPNLTTGTGGIGGRLKDEDYVRAIRHGVDRDHRTLLIMPANVYSDLSDTDVQNLVAYLKSLSPVNRNIPETTPGPMLLMLYAFGQFPALAPAALIEDHNAPVSNVDATVVSIANGKYQISICAGCHGNTLKGKDSQVPGGKHASDLTLTGHPGRWTEEQFIHVLRTGETPEGKQLDPKDMPWTITANFTDEEIRSIYQYLHTLQ